MTPRALQCPPGVWIEFETLDGHRVALDVQGLYEVQETDAGATLLGFVVPGTSQVEERFDAHEREDLGLIEPALVIHDSPLLC